MSHPKNLTPYQTKNPLELIHTGEKRGFVVILFIIIISLILISSVQGGFAKFDWASALLGMIPVIPITIMWYMEKKQKWQATLPSYLNVTLRDPIREIARFELIPIQQGSDIRQQAQSVLGQISNGRVNSLENFIRPKALTTAQTMIDNTQKIADGQPFTLTSVTLHMTEKVATQATQATQDKNKLAALDPNKIWYWSPIEHGGPPTPTDLSDPKIKASKH